LDDLRRGIVDIARASAEVLMNVVPTMEEEE